MGGCLSSSGELEASRQHFDAALAAYDELRPQRSALGSDLGVFAHAWGSHTHWLLGDEDAAMAHAERAIALAQRLDHVYSQALAFAYAGLLHQFRLDAPRVRTYAEAAVALCDKAGRPALSGLLNGKAGLSGDMALRIEKAFGVKMDTLMRMQASYDIAQTRKREKEIRVPRFHPPAEIHP